MGRALPPRGLPCPTCGAGLEPVDPVDPDVVRLGCPDCGETFVARRRVPIVPEVETPPDGLTLVARAWALHAVTRLYPCGVGGLSLSLLVLGGSVPVLAAWLRDEVVSIAEAVDLLGGLRVRRTSTNPDADLGPTLGWADAPVLFRLVNEVAREVGARPPDQIRLAYLPCCGVAAGGRSRALLIGLPLLHILTHAELRAVLAHELAHLARGDATRSADDARFVEGLGRALEDSTGHRWSPLRLWAKGCYRVASRLGAPIARGQEVRADRIAASLAGGETTASALIKVALIQPLFREVLALYDAEAPPSGLNLYAFFRTFWGRLSDSLMMALRIDLMTRPPSIPDPTHPPLPDRLAAVGSYPEPLPREGDRIRAASALGDVEWFEQLLHYRLFGLNAVEPTVYHKAGT